MSDTLQFNQGNSFCYADAVYDRSLYNGSAKAYSKDLGGCEALVRNACGGIGAASVPALHYHTQIALDAPPTQASPPQRTAASAAFMLDGSQRLVIGKAKSNTRSKRAVVILFPL